jgi:urease accessory protein
VASVVPLELRGPFRDSGLPGYYLRNTTAGVLDGDAYRVDLVVEPGAAVHVGASSASKVYAGASSVDIRLDVGPGALLEWGPHSAILHAGADYRQETRIRLGAGSRAVVAEVLALGRLARGERYEFHRLDSVFEVAGPRGEALYSEAYTVSPGPDLLASTAGFGVLASVYALGFEASTAGECFRCAPRGCGPGGWSALPNGCGVVGRLLADSLSRGGRFCEDLAWRLVQPPEA